MPPDHAPPPNAPQRDRPAPADFDPRYLLHNRLEILAVMRGLVGGHALISARVVPGGDSFLTAVLEVDEEGGMLLDGDRDMGLNARIAAAERLDCVTHLDKIRIQFSVTGMKRVTEGSSVGFRVPMPTQLLRLQRRAFYRLQVPVAARVNCVVPVRDKEGDTHTVTLRIIDISGGGVALSAPPKGFDMVPGMHFEGCTLMLPDAMPITAQLTVRSVFRISQRNGIEAVRAGCEFTGLSVQDSDAIQRYILRVERERNARSRGAL